VREKGPSTRPRGTPWLVVLALIATACTSSGPQTAGGKSIEAAPAPSSFGSPDHATIAFHADPGGRDDTYVMDDIGGHVVGVTDGIETVAQPYWSPDGERLAISCCTSGFGQLFVADGPGAPLVAIAPDVPGVANPTWSPDGHTIAFGSIDDGMLYLVDVSEGTPEAPRPLVSGAAPAWSPDGSRLAYFAAVDGNLDIYSVATDGSDVERLTRDPAPEYSPVWSPEGDRIAFVSERDGDQDIAVTNVDGTHPIDVSRDRWPDDAPVWSPDGRWIAFVAYLDGADPHTIGDGNAEIVVARADGSHRRNLSRNAAWDGDPTWSPDGASIAFTRRTGHAAIYVMRSDGSDQRRLRGTPGTANDCCPAWRP
jgi:Tol biopolymer transport system component